MIDRKVLVVRELPQGVPRRVGGRVLESRLEQAGLLMTQGDARRDLRFRHEARDEREKDEDQHQRRPVLLSGGNRGGLAVQRKRLPRRDRIAVQPRMVMGPAVLRGHAIAEYLQSPPDGQQDEADAQVAKGHHQEFVPHDGCAEKGNAQRDPADEKAEDAQHERQGGEFLDGAMPCVKTVCAPIFVFVAVV